MIRIDGKDYKIWRSVVIGDELVTSIEEIKTGEFMSLSYSQLNGYLLWIPCGTVLDPGVEMKVPAKVEFNIPGENGNGVLNMVGRENRCIRYSARQFFN